ncbi:MAG: hypothetical protein Kow0090_14140 [Myxococcota bacterium]
MKKRLILFFVIILSLSVTLAFCTTETKEAPFDNDSGMNIPDMGDGDDDDDGQWVCESNDDCEEGFGCVEGACRAFCDASASCEEGFMCKEGFCIPSCKNDSDCGDGMICREGECVFQSDDDDDGDATPIDDDDDDECSCYIPGAEYKCAGGECYFQKCKEGYLNLNGTLEDGCEYFCKLSNDGVEVCDEKDNDCDGATDNLLDFMSSVEHCGDCKTRCEDPANAKAYCQQGKCKFVCNDGFYDNDDNPDNGCESNECIESNGGVEICDGKDNDCDGKIDEGFDKESKTSCGLGCADCTQIAPHYLYECEEGGCVFKGCENGWYDFDGDVENGCEYRCSVSGVGYEKCNGRDDDCNLKTPDGSEDPMVGIECLTGLSGVCSEGVMVCGSLGKLKCVAKKGIAEICNGVDDDCNGFVDDNAPCDGGKKCVQGVCKEVTCQDECAPAGMTCKTPAVILKCIDTDGDGCNNVKEESCGSGAECIGGECVEICVPNCEGKECGEDGCEGSCGDCITPPPAECKDAKTRRTYSSAGTCDAGVCAYSVSSEETCPPEEICEGGICKCLTLKCGGACCPSGTVCYNNACCAPSCSGKQCGGDGCGGICGECSGNQFCSEGKCATIIFVKADATGANNGASWSDAYTKIQDALSAAQSGNHIWVAAGTYTKKNSYDTYVITMKEGVFVYGGFAGSEMSFDQRGNPLGDNKSYIEGASNTTCIKAASNSLLDGFIAKGCTGYGSGGGVYAASVSGFTISNSRITENSAGTGGGIYLSSANNIKIENTEISKNIVNGQGGAIWAASSSVTISRGKVQENKSLGYGGGIYATSSTIDITDSMFDKNQGTDGGAIFTNVGAVTILKSVIVNNISTGCIGGGGGIFSGNNTLTVKNAVFANNEAKCAFGGAVYNNYDKARSFINCTFYNNYSKLGGGGIFNNIQSKPRVVNSILWAGGDPQGQIYDYPGYGSSTTARYSDVEGGFDGEGNINAAPKFIDGGAGNFRLQSDSPCIDAADGNEAPAGDIDGNPRFDAPLIPNTGGGTHDYIDMGAYEFQG